MLSTIKKGCHYRDKGMRGLHYGKEALQYTINLQKPSGLDKNDHINKLFGLSFGLHHNNSARFGWRTVSSDRFELFSYCYENGFLCTNSLGKLKFNCYYDLSIWVRYYGLNVDFFIDDQFAHTEPFKEIPKLGYLLGFYYGGEPTAPQEYKLFYNKILKR